MAEDLMAAAAASIEASRAAEDPDRPLVHLAPPVGRLNDPNGLVREAGVVHAFYQFSPFHPHRKLVYWGHASSTDLLHWQDHGPALAPDRWYDSHGVYSGTAIPTDEGVALFYTGNVRHEDGGRSAYQCLATTKDLNSVKDLVPATKHPKNPVVDPLPEGYTAHVRDPQVWQDEDGSYRMLLGAQRLDETGCALLLRSTDLLDWQFEGELTFPDAGGTFEHFGYMWECPSLVRIPDEQGELHDVLILCPQGIEPLGEGYGNIFACGYVVGRLDGTALRETGSFHELDRGFEFYAPQVVASADPGPVQMMAWVGNASEDDQPSIEHDWVHLMSCVRELTLHEGRLVQRPAIATEDALELHPFTIGPQPLCPAELVGSRSFLLELTLDATQAASWSLSIGQGESVVRLELAGRTMTVDRSATRYPHGERRIVTLPEDMPLDRITVQVLHDRSVDEFFLADGRVSFTMRSYLSPDASGLGLQADGTVRVIQGRVLRFD